MPNLLQAQSRTATVSRPGDGMLVAIDARVEACQMLADSALPGAKVIIIHPDKDGVEQITAALVSSQASSLHVVCHGETGCLHLGKTPLHGENLQQYRQQLQQWRVRDIVLVACHVAGESELHADSEARSFLRQLRELAGANIAASARRVGNPARGGSWELEYRLGDVSSPLAFLPEIYQTYPGIFPPSFSTASNFTVGGNPKSVIVGDLNGDGKLDLAAPDTANNSVKVMLGNGTGFAAPGNFAVGNAPESVSVGDLNGDGKLDLVAANGANDTVTVLLGNGTGTAFPTSNTFGVGDNPQSASVGDFNGDGKLDLVTANGASDTVTVLLGNGTGTAFPTSNTFGVGDNPQSVTVEDFNQDGKLDLVTANATDGTVTVLLGNGTGTSFSAPNTFAVGNNPQSAIAADFNQDGKLDLAAANYDDGTVTVLLGNGTGTAFSPSVTFTAAGGTNSVAVGDFNQDGKLDLAATNFLAGTITVGFGDGTGTAFPTSASFATGSAPWYSAVGDFNGDGKVDLAATTGLGRVALLSNLTPTVSLAAGNAPSETGPANGTYTITLDKPAPAGGLTVNYTLEGSATVGADYAIAQAASTNVTAITATSFTIAEGQTSATLAVVPVDDGVIEPGGETVTLKLNPGIDYILAPNNGAPIEVSSGGNFPTGMGPNSIVVTDFNGDGKLDFATTNINGNTVTVRLGDGTGTGFATASTWGTGTFPSSIAVGDFNGDGKLDFAVANYGLFPADPDTVTVRLGDGTGTGFTNVATLTVAPDPNGLSFGDFNGDGKLDFIVGSSNQSNGNTVAVWLGDGTGTGFTSVATLTVGTQPQSTAVGDFNGDGKLDFAAAGLGGGNITVWLGDGTGTGFTTSSTLAVGNNPFGLSAADFNGDGKLDLAVANSLDDTVTVLLGNGTGTGFSSTTIAVGGYPATTAVGDFNGDGKLDLAVSNQSDSSVTVLFGDGTGTGFSSTTFTGGTGVVAVADFNGDGKVDFATPNFGSGNVPIFLNLPQPQATLTIADNDVASVVVTPAGTTVAEGGATLTYTVVLTSQPTADVNIAISPDSQTTTDATTLTFNATNWNVAQTVTVTAVDDGFIEGTHTSTISHAATSTDLNYNGIAVAPVTANIADNDTAGVLITPISPAAAEGGATASYKVMLTSQPDADVTIAISSDAQTTTDVATLTFTIANWNIEQTVTVTAVDDSIAEGNHTGNITHTATSIDTIYNIPVAGFAAEIADNDTAGVLIAATSPTATEGGATLTYTVVLTSQPTADVAIAISPDSQTTTNAATITFNATNWNQPQTVTVTAVDDTFAEGNHTGNIAHAVTSTDANYNNIAVNSVTANITDNDSPGISINPTATGAAEGGATGSYTIVLTTAPAADVTVNFNTGSQINAIAPITFTPSNWDVVQTVTVTAVDDAAVEGTHAGTISHAATSTDVNYNGLASAAVSVEIADNDTANNPPVLQNAIADIRSTASTPFNFTFPANTFTDPDGDALTYTAALEDGSPLPLWLTFDATTGTFSGTPTPNNLGSVNVKVTASDGSLSASDVFAITVSEEPNNPPVVVTPIADNRVAVSANLSYAIAAEAFSDPDGDALTFTATLEDGSPLPAWLTFDANTRTFAGTPTANNLGNINIKVTVSDGSLTASDIFALTVFETPTPTPTPTPNPVPTPTPNPVPTPTPNPLPTPTFSPAPTAVDTGCLCDVFPTPDVGTPTLTPNQIAETLQGTEGNDLAFGDATAEAFNVKDGSDIVSGLRGGDNIYGGAGVDFLFGNEGSDYIDGGTGSDIIFAGKDNDAVTGGVDNDTVVGDIADDALLGGDGADMLFGNTGADAIDGEAGDDIIFGGKDNDALKGNIGNDVILGDVGNDTILGNEGNDFIYGNTGADFVAGGAGEDTLFSGKENDIVKGGAGNDIASGDIGSDSVCGGEGNDVLFGNIGADSMDGCEGDDALYGGKDSDTLIGNQGNDILFGEMGSDSLIGGTGSDTFVLTRNGGSDIVYDFEDGSDRFALSGGLTIEQLSVTSNGSGTDIAIASTGELLATLNNVQSSPIAAEDFVLI